jgi:hypothetical protein
MNIATTQVLLCAAEAFLVSSWPSAKIVLGVTMAGLSRRAFVANSAAGIAAASLPADWAMAAQCVTGPLPPFLPNSLTVDCASKRNFRTFRANPQFVGLTGVVTMTFVKGKYGSYTAGNLSLFPWLKPKGKRMSFPAVLPVNATQVMNATPIPDATLPLDQYFCNYVLQAPWQSFIGFLVDKPYSGDDTRRDWFTNVDKLADGHGVGIDWTSHNLNGPWFGGSHWVPKNDTCSGSAWRALIIAALNQASTAAC